MLKRLAGLVGCTWLILGRMYDSSNKWIAYLWKVIETWCIFENDDKAFLSGSLLVLKNHCEHDFWTWQSGLKVSHDSARAQVQGVLRVRLKIWTWFGILSKEMKTSRTSQNSFSQASTPNSSRMIVMGLSFPKFSMQILQKLLLLWG